MEPVLTPEARSRADQRTIDAGTPVSVLMERAGRAVAWEVRRSAGGTCARRVVVVCGKGQNGGSAQGGGRGGWGRGGGVWEGGGVFDRRSASSPPPTYAPGCRAAHPTRTSGSPR